VDKRNLNWITWGFVVLTVLIVLVMLTSTLRRPTRITLPEPETIQDQTTLTPDTSEDSLTMVSITPETVQDAIATLTRPDIYRRTVTVEQFWSGGSGSFDTTVSVISPWTRTDRVMPDGRVRHTIIGEDTSYIWYNNESEIYFSTSGDISPDNEQSIPTYENILELSASSILTADYRSISNIACIYVETAPDEAGYSLRYWVSVDNGLLVAAEKLLSEEIIYRMSALNLDPVQPDETAFLLPDGTSPF